MPLDALLLDDLTWDDLVQAARSRIPAASKGQWTLHAPVDPGITLLELFAGQLEERLYWMDQPCDARARAILKLLGVTPRPALVAATVLAFFANNEPEAAFARIPRHTVLTPQAPANSPGPIRSSRNRNTTPPPEFATEHAILFFPLDVSDGARGLAKCIELKVGDEDRTLDLQTGKAPRLLMDGDGGALDVEITLRLREPIPEEHGYLSLLLDLETPDAIASQWLPGAAPPSAVAEVTWFYATEQGFQPFDPGAVKDGTKGLRRSGVVRLPIRGNMGWRPSDGNRYTLRMRIREAHYPAPPRLRQIVPNAVVARHRRLLHSTAPGFSKLTEFLRQWNRVKTPNAVWQMPLSADSVLPHTVRLWLQRKHDGPLDAWLPVDDLVFSGPGESCFRVDRATSQLHFGDGYHGRMPVTETGEFRITLEIGGGPIGNLSSGRIWEVVKRSPSPCATAHRDGWLAVNVVAATGGEDAETIADAAKRAAHEWRRPSRTVTPADFEYLAQQTPGVAIGRAHAVVGLHPLHPCVPVEGAVTVFVIPEVPRPERDEWLAHPNVWSALHADSATLDAVRQHLDRARLVTQEVFVLSPSYDDIAVTVWIGGVPADAEPIRQDLTLELCRFFHPLWGGAEGNGWPFGGDVFPSAVMQRIQQTLPDGLLVTDVAIARSQSPLPADHCAPLAIAALMLPRLVQVHFRFAPAAQTEGGLG